MTIRHEAAGPIISVITVVRYDSAGLKRTMASVLGQDYLRLDYIVVDGGVLNRCVAPLPVRSVRPL